MHRYSPPPRRSRKPKVDRGEDPFMLVRAHIPRRIYEELKAISDERGVPVSRLINFALYNEMEVQNPFDFDLELPVDEFKPGLFLSEADIVHAFLARLPSGCGLDNLVLMKHDLGLTRKQILLGYMQLKHEGRIEEYKPIRHSFTYHEDYRYIRVVDIHHQTMVKNRLKSFDGKSVRKKLCDEK